MRNIYVLCFVAVATFLSFITIADCRSFMRHRKFDALGLGIGKRALEKLTGTSSVRCNRIEGAFQRIVDAMQESADDEQAQMIAQQVMTSSGVDITDQGDIRRKSCELADVTSVADMAAMSGASISTARQQYGVFVRYARTLIDNLRVQASSYYNPASLRRIYAATADFYTTLQEMGYFDLQ